MNIQYTQYRSLYSLDDLRPVETTWSELVTEFSQHLRVGKKDQAPGFGPYVLKSPSRPCSRHKDGRPRPGPHRCDDCVASITMAVFDVDVGTMEQIDKCQARLKDHGIAQLWYSSYSFDTAKPRPPFRLMIPLKTPVHPDNWQPFREALIRRMDIPADPVACSGVSHFYYLPSCPVDADPVVDYVDGEPLDPGSVPFTPPAVGRSVVVAAMDDWELPEDPTGPVDLEPIRARLRAKASGLARRMDSKDRQKGELLSRCLRGEALADHGERNNATLRVAGMLAWSLPDQPLAVLRHLMLPSVRQMQAEGSTLKDSELDRMLVSSMRDRAESDKRLEGMNDVFKKAAELREQRAAERTFKGNLLWPKTYAP